MQKVSILQFFKMSEIAKPLAWTDPYTCFTGMDLQYLSSELSKKDLMDIHEEILACWIRVPQNQCKSLMGLDLHDFPHGNSALVIIKINHYYVQNPLH